MRVKSSLVSAITLLLTSTSLNLYAKPEMVELKLSAPEKFTDALYSGKTRKQSFEQLEKDLGKLFTKVAESALKNGYQLKLEIINVDLAGNIDFASGAGHNDLRIVKDVEHYRLKFNFKLLSPKGELINSGEQEFKGFLDLKPSRVKMNQYSSVSYFAKYAEEWLKSLLVE